MKTTFLTICLFILAPVLLNAQEVETHDNCGTSDVFFDYQLIEQTVLPDFIVHAKTEMIHRTVINDSSIHTSFRVKNRFFDFIYIVSRKIILEHKQEVISEDDTIVI